LAWLDGKMAEGGTCLIAERDGAPAGFAACITGYDDFAFVTPRYRRFGLVMDLYVAPEHRRQGVARALLSAAEAFFRAQGFTKMEITALGPNKAARATYEALFGDEVAATYARYFD
ncbi:MAG: GNAT family N-acetyltransferase, partial [Pseudomonadota bacterium]